MARFRFFITFLIVGIPSALSAQPHPQRLPPLVAPEPCTTDVLSGGQVRLDYTIPNLRPSGDDGDVQVIYSPHHNWIRAVGFNGAVYQANRSSVRNFYNDVTVTLRNTSTRDMWEADCWRTTDQNLEVIRIVDKRGQWSIDQGDCDGDDDDDVFWSQGNALSFVLDEDVGTGVGEGQKPGTSGPRTTTCAGGGGGGGGDGMSCSFEWICIDVWVTGEGWVEFWCGSATICTY